MSIFDLTPHARTTQEIARLWDLREISAVQAIGMCETGANGQQEWIDRLKLEAEHHGATDNDAYQIARREALAKEYRDLAERIRPERAEELRQAALDNAGLAIVAGQLEGRLAKKEEQLEAVRPDLERARKVSGGAATRGAAITAAAKIRYEKMRRNYGKRRLTIPSESKGTTIQYVARHFGVSTETVRRALKKK